METNINNSKIEQKKMYHSYYIKQKFRSVSGLKYQIAKKMYIVEILILPYLKVTNKS